MRGLLLVLAWAGLAAARVMTRCQLVKALDEAGFRRSLIPDWICMAESASSRNTTARGGPHKNGSYDHGIFQINDSYWCDVGKQGKECNVDCNDLEKDDIRPSIACARIIFALEGFNSWDVWVRRCRNRRLPKVNHCFRIPTRRSTRHPHSYSNSTSVDSRKFRQH